MVLVLDMLFELAMDDASVADLLEFGWWSVNPTGGDNFHATARMHAESTASTTNEVLEGDFRVEAVLASGTDIVHLCHLLVIVGREVEWSTWIFYYRPSNGRASFDFVTSGSEELIRYNSKAFMKSGAHCDL